jgi:hypothetical protein
MVVFQQAVVLLPTATLIIIVLGLGEAQAVFHQIQLLVTRLVQTY